MSGARQTGGRLEVTLPCRETGSKRPICVYQGKLASGRSAAEAVGHRATTPVRCLDDCGPSILTLRTASTVIGQHPINQSTAASGSSNTGRLAKDGRDAFVQPECCAHRLASLFTFSNLRLLGDLQCVIDLNTKVSHSRFKFGVAEQQLYGSQILGALVNQRGLGPAH